ncbi:MAG: AEC family transporter [Clostridia bacterium]|nr:AEC family transporter [Clostridia bacterium]
MLGTFLAALGVVGTMLVYAVPGFALVKTKMVKEESISAFARLLMFVGSPCLVFTSVTRNTFSYELVKELLIAFVIIISIFLTGLLVFSLIFKRKKDDVRYRIYNLATTMANCAFMGVPVLEALLPDYPEAVAVSAMASLALNIIGWSLASYIISQDKKYIRFDKILVNPATIAFAIAIPFFLFGIGLPEFLGNAVSLFAKMTTPLCMLIMGMRLACVPIKGVFLQPMQYLIIAIKQIVIPLLTLLILLPLPLSPEIKSSIYIMMACPVASVTLSFAEMIGKGQSTAANLVLLGTSLSIVTIPIMSMLIYLF